MPNRQQISPGGFYSVPCAIMPILLSSAAVAAVLSAPHAFLMEGKRQRKGLLASVVPPAALTAGKSQMKGTVCYHLPDRRHVSLFLSSRF